MKDFIVTPNSTVLYYNGAYWYSPETWESPKDGLGAQPGKWLWLGSPGWFRDKETKAKFEALCVAVGKDNLPTYPGEYMIIDEELLVL